MQDRQMLIQRLAEILAKNPQMASQLAVAPAQASPMGTMPPLNVGGLYGFPGQQAQPQPPIPSPQGWY